MSPLQCLKAWEKLPTKQRTGKLAKQYAKKVGMKSMGEVKCACVLSALKRQKKIKKYDYESEKWVYQFDPQKYTPDFPTITKNKDTVCIEYKGKMTDATRKKLRYIKKCNPDKRLVIVFERAVNKLKRGSPTSYGKWASDNGFDWIDASNLSSRTIQEYADKMEELINGS